MFKRALIDEIEKGTGRKIIISFPNGEFENITTGIHSGTTSLEKTLCEDADNVLIQGCIASEFKTTIEGIDDITNIKIQIKQIVGDYEYALFTGYVDECVLRSDRKSRDIVAYDEFYIASGVNVSNWYNNLVFPIDIGDFLKSLLDYVGIGYVDTLNVKQAFNVNKTIDTNNLSFEMVIKAICSVIGAFGVINAEGLFDLVYLSKEVYGKPLNAMSGFELEQYTVEAIDKVVVRSEETDIGSNVGNGNNQYVIQGNFLCFGMNAEQLHSIAEKLYTNVAGFAWRKCLFNLAVSNPLIGCDGIKYRVITSQGDDFETYIFNSYLSGVQLFDQELESYGSEYRSELGSDSHEEYLVTSYKVMKLSSTIEGFYLELESKVDGKELITKINASSEKVLISSSKLDIEGIVKFINGDDSSKTLINGGRIETGSIKAESLDIDEIFADSAFVDALRTNSLIVGLTEDIASTMPLINGTHTTATQTWTGVAPFSNLKDGQVIMYGLPNRANSGNATLTLTLSDGTKTSALPIYYNGANRLTTQYNAGSSIIMTYRENVKIGNNTYSGWWTTVDSNTYDRTRYSSAIKAKTAIVANNLIVGDSSGYFHLKTGSAFDINYPILFAVSAITSGGTGNNNYIIFPLTITTTQSITLTAYKPVYIKGKLNGSMFTPVSTTPLTQTVPTTVDGYQYILLGIAYSTTAMYLLAEHPIYEYIKGAFRTVADAIKSNIYTSGKTTIDGGIITTGSIKAGSIDVNDLFARNITIPDGGKFTAIGKAWLRPGWEEYSLVRDYILYSTGTFTTNQKKTLDFNKSGAIDLQDFVVLKRLVNTDKTLQSVIDSYGYAPVYSDITVTIDPKNPDKVLRMTATNSYDRDVDIYFGVAGLRVPNAIIDGYINAMSITLSGDLKLTESSADALSVGLTNSKGSISLKVNEQGKMGLYNLSTDDWILQSDSSGNTTLNCNTLNSSLVTGTYLAGNQGTAIINSTAAAGKFTMLSKLNSTNGYFIDGVYNGDRVYYYTISDMVDVSTPSNSYTKRLILLNESGNSTFPGTVTISGGASIAGTLTLTRNQDASGITDNAPALIVGGARTAAHLEMDANEIMAKANGTTTAPLYINSDGGDIYLGSNATVNAIVNGPIKATGFIDKATGSSVLPFLVDKSTNANGAIRFPNIKMQIAWMRYQAAAGGIGVNTAWGSVYTGTQRTLPGWVAPFSSQPVIIKQAVFQNSSGGKAAAITATFGDGTASVPGVAETVRGSALSPGSNYGEYYYAIAIGPYA